MADNLETPKGESKFDFSAYPADTVFYERRTGQDRRADAAHATGPILAPETIAGESGIPPQIHKRAKTKRRRRIDPTTFEKQYTDDELEFMNAMQKFKVQSGKTFPTHGEVLRVAQSLGYRRIIIHDDSAEGSVEEAVVACS